MGPGHADAASAKKDRRRKRDGEDGDELEKRFWEVMVVSQF
jgi:hypothetical protein